MAASDRLPFYVERFDAVELNSSFYAIPAESTVESWNRATPQGFRFDEAPPPSLTPRGPAEGPADGLRDDVETNERGRVLPDR